MQQVVDLQNDKGFQGLGIELLSISPDSVSAWLQNAADMKIHLPVLSDSDNVVANRYGVMRWRHGNEPGHTFVLVGSDGRVKWVRDYGAPEHGGLMYVAPSDLTKQIASHLSA